MITIVDILTGMAWAGGLALVFQLASVVFGFDTTDTDVDTELGDDGGVRMFSILGFTSFLFMFGLVGRYFILTVGLHLALSILIAFAVGVGSMYLVAYLFYKAKSLETNGTIRIQNALDCTGTVYLPFKNDLNGTVHINVNGIMREYDGKAFDGKGNFKVGDSVKVKEVKGNFVEVIKN